MVANDDAQESVTSPTLGGVLHRLRAGERGTDPGLARQLDAAFGKHEEALRRLCGKELRGFPPERIEEVVQDVLLEVWTKLAAPGDGSTIRRFRAYLFQIATYKCANIRRKCRDNLAEDGFFDELAAEDASALRSLVAEERSALVDEAIREVLDPVDRRVVHLRWVAEHSFEAIVERVGLGDVDEVRVILQRSRRRLRKEIPRLLTERGLGTSFLRDGA